MAIFPQLKTGAVAQYPISRVLQYHNQTVRFVDGTDQRYRDSGSVRQRWEIQYSSLDETELAAIEDFFLQCQGAFGSFTFIDPWDGTVHDDCSLESGDLDLTAIAETRNLTQLTVVRNS